MLESEVEVVSSMMSASTDGSTELLAASTSPAPHPFENDAILEAVLKTCEPEDLNECRLVSKQWYDVSLPVWRDGPRIDLEDSPDQSSSMAKFLQDVKKGLANSVGSAPAYEFGGISHYKNFRITCDGGRSSWSLEESFWSVCGGWIRKLTLTNFNFQDLQTFKKLVGCSFTPSLESLMIHGAEFGFDIMVPMMDDHELESEESQNLSEMNVNVHLKSLSVVETNLPVSWRELLRCFPYLESLELVDYGEWDWEKETTEVFDAITKIRRMDNKKMPLKSLEIVITSMAGCSRAKHIFPASLESFLRNSQLHLKTLTLYVKPDTPVSALYGTLVLQSKSLKYLSLSDADLAHFRWPTMKVLETLKLEDSESGNLNFLKECPKLKTLEIMKDVKSLSVTIIQNTSNEVLMDGVVVSSLTNFQCDYNFDYSLEDIARLRQWMPNLKTLQLKLSNEQLRMVVKLWPALEELFLCRFSAVDDEGITGIPADWERLGIRLYPNLTDLKNLRSLRIGEVDGDTRRRNYTSITDKSATFGFLQMESLHSLSLQLANSLTPATLNLLKKKLSNLGVRYNRPI